MRGARKEDIRSLEQQIDDKYFAEIRRLAQVSEDKNPTEEKTQVLGYKPTVNEAGEVDQEAVKHNVVVFNHYIGTAGTALEGSDKEAPTTVVRTAVRQVRMALAQNLKAWNTKFKAQRKAERRSKVEAALKKAEERLAALEAEEQAEAEAN